MYTHTYANRVISPFYSCYNYYYYILGVGHTENKLYNYNIQNNTTSREYVYATILEESNITGLAKEIVIIYCKGNIGEIILL